MLGVGPSKDWNALWKRLPPQDVLHAIRSYHSATLRMIERLLPGPVRSKALRVTSPDDVGYSPSDYVASYLGDPVPGRTRRQPCASIAAGYAAAARQLVLYAQVYAPQYDGLADDRVREFSRRCTARAIEELRVEVELAVGEVVDFPTGRAKG